MSRRDTHLDALLRHLGAAHYDSLHGRAKAADVASAPAAVEEPPAELPAASGHRGAGRPRPAPGNGSHRRHGRGTAGSAG
jgi:hypothetical protein